MYCAYSNFDTVIKSFADTQPENRVYLSVTSLALNDLNIRVGI